MKAKLNPFNPNSTVTPALFAGRVEQVLQILNKLKQVREGMPASFVLQGDRGIGKTALSKLIMYLAELNLKDFDGLKFITSYYTVDRNQPFDSVLEASLNTLTDKMPESVVKRLTERFGDYFKNGKFSFGAFGMSFESGKKDTEKETLLKDRAVSALSNIISGIEEIQNSEDQKDGILIVIDEIHNVSDVSGVAQIIRGITTTLDVNRKGKVSFLIIGYPEGIDRFFEGDPSARRHFDIIGLGVMSNEETKEVLVKGFEKAEVEYDATVLENNVHVAGGYPHSIQIIGHNLIEQDNDGKIDSDDWFLALGRSAEQLTSKEFSDMYAFDGIHSLRDQVLNVMALVGRPISKSELKEQVGGKNIYTSTCLTHLRKIGAVKESEGLLTLHSNLFRGAILIHLYKNRNRSEYNELIERFEKIPTQTAGTPPSITS